MMSRFRRLFSSPRPLVNVIPVTTTVINPKPAPIIHTPTAPIDVDSVFTKIEGRDPSVLYLYNIGDGHIWYPSNMDLEGVRTEPITTWLGTSHVKPVFSHEILIAESWDKNGVYYNLDKSRFPNLKTIVMMSHPCDYSVPRRYKEATWICPYHTKRYFDGHPGYVETTQAQTDRLYAALKGMPRLTTTRGGGSSGHDLTLCKESK